MAFYLEKRQVSDDLDSALGPSLTSGSVSHRGPPLAMMSTSVRSCHRHGATRSEMKHPLTWAIRPSLSIDTTGIQKR